MRHQVVCAASWLPATMPQEFLQFVAVIQRGTMKQSAVQLALFPLLLSQPILWVALPLPALAFQIFKLYSTNCSLLRLLIRCQMQIFQTREGCCSSLGFKHQVCWKIPLGKKKPYRGLICTAYRSLLKPWIRRQWFVSSLWEHLNEASSQWRMTLVPLNISNASWHYHRVVMSSDVMPSQCILCGFLEEICYLTFVGKGIRWWRQNCGSGFTTWPRKFRNLQVACKRLNDHIFSILSGCIPLTDKAVVLQGSITAVSIRSHTYGQFGKNHLALVLYCCISNKKGPLCIFLQLVSCLSWDMTALVAVLFLLFYGFHTWKESSAVPFIIWAHLIPCFTSMWKELFWSNVNGFLAFCIAL